MSDCASIDPLVTPYVDGEIAPDERQRIEAHLRRCPPCDSRVMAERAVRRLIQRQRPALCGERASPVLRAACAGMRACSRGQAPGATRAAWRASLVPFALAATLFLIVGGAFLYEATDLSARVMAAELTADHVKCFTMNGVLHTHDSPAAVQSSMLSGFGWRMQVPPALEHLGLELVGSRPCLYGQGRIAHLMYLHHGQPVSVFMLPNALRTDEVVEVLGHEAVIWSIGGRTFVLIAREPRAEVERMASTVQAAMR
jgi:anti-sigma factor RsiW